MTSGPTAGRPADILTTYLVGPLHAAGFDLEDVAVRRAGRSSVVAVTVDRDGAIDLDAIAEASRVVSSVLDERDAELPAALGDSYTLEVSSRGADAPLTQPRHWRRAVGRLVDLKLRDGKSVLGRVQSADDEQAVLLATPKPHKPGAKVSSKPPAEVVVRYTDIGRAVIELEFTSPDGDDFDELVDDELTDEFADDTADDADDVEFNEEGSNR